MYDLDFKKIKKLKKLNSYSAVITSEDPSQSVKARRISIPVIIAGISVYSLIIAIIVSAVFLFTPLREKIATKSSALTNQERFLLEELGYKLTNLNSEVENLKTTNQKLKKAIELGDSTIIFDAPQTNKNHKNKISAGKATGGNLFYIVNRLLEEYGFTRHSDLFTRPVNGFISRGFELKKGHLGIDYVVKTGTPVYAAGNGYVVFSDYTANDGYMVIVAHNDNYMTVYKHCSSLMKKTRDIVEQGELIALSGNTGLLTTGPHLHFEVWRNGQAIDPKTVLVN